MHKTPTYRERKGRGQAIVTLTDSATKRRKDFWLGEYGSRESREAYHRVVAAWEARGRRWPDVNVAPVETADGPTITEIIRDYWTWAKRHFHVKHASAIKTALRVLRELYGSTAAADFGPRKLRLVRDQMIHRGQDSGQARRWSRPYINAQVLRIRHLFKWAAAQELVPVSVFQSLATLEPLKRGKSSAPETEKVGPVPDTMLDAVRPYLNRPVQALVELQLLTGARPSELLGLRPADIDFGDGATVWRTRLSEHNTAHRGQTRIIYFGPKAQAILRQFLANRATSDFLFCPAEASEDRQAARHRARITPPHRGNAPGTNRRESPLREPGDRYTPASYYRSIQYACARAFPLPEHLAPSSGETRRQWAVRLTAAEKAELHAWRRRRSFHPYQLRHSAATYLRRAFGLEAAQLVLGHASAAITDAVYAERDDAKVVEIMRKIG